MTNCQAAVNVLEGVHVDLRNNDLSFNEAGCQGTPPHALHPPACLACACAHTCA